jgi:hypothetical protein
MITAAKIRQSDDGAAPSAWHVCSADRAILTPSTHPRAIFLSSADDIRLARLASPNRAAQLAISNRYNADSHASANRLDYVYYKFLIDAKSRVSKTTILRFFRGKLAQ